MTNYERIKAEYTLEDFAYWHMCPYEEPDCKKADFNCLACTRNWLESEVDDGND